MTATSPMLPDFPSWYATLGLGAADDLYERRWAAVCAVATCATPKQVEGLLRIAFNTKQPPSEDVVTGLHGTIRKIDPTASLDNRRELQIFAGAALAAIVTGGGEGGARASLAITTTAGYGRKPPELPFDLAALANVGLGNIANAVRKRTPISINSAEIPVDLSVPANKAAVNNWQSINESITAVGPVVQKALGTLLARQTNVARALNGIIAIQDEELNLLWWLFGGYSRDFQRRFQDIPEDNRPLVIAKELSDLTSYLPGPASVRALLSRAGLDERPVTIATVVNSVNQDWSRPLVQESPPSPVSTPIHFAIDREIETGPGSDWLANWSAVTELDPGANIPALTLGTLFYQERLLLRVAK